MESEAAQLTSLLRTLRKKRGVLVSQLIVEGVVSNKELFYRWERGEIMPKLASLLRWADALGFRLVLMEKSECDRADQLVWSPNKKLEELL